MSRDPRASRAPADHPDRWDRREMPASRARKGPRATRASQDRQDPRATSAPRARQDQQDRKDPRATSALQVRQGRRDPRARRDRQDPREKSAPRGRRDPRETRDRAGPAERGAAGPPGTEGRRRTRRAGWRRIDHPGHLRSGGSGVPIRRSHDQRVLQRRWQHAAYQRDRRRELRGAGQHEGGNRLREKIGRKSGIGRRLPIPPDIADARAAKVADLLSSSAAVPSPRGDEARTAPGQCER